MHYNLYQNIMKKIMLSLFIAFGFSACSLNDDSLNVDCGTYKDLSFTGFPLPCNYTIKTPPTTPASLVATSQADIDKYFTKHTNSCPNPSDPTIDFTKNYLVGIFSGLKQTNGYEIKVASIIENDCQLVINYFERAPLPGETLSQVANYPADFILIPKTEKPIVFIKTIESSDNAVIGSFATQCVGSDCQKFFQISDFNSLKFLNVVYGSYDFAQYKYTATAKRGDYTALLKTVPTEILNLKGQTKTYGSPDDADQGGVYFQLRQGIVVTKVYIDNKDTADQSLEIRAFKKAIQDKITSLK